jgi:hypothetical protein
MYVCMCVCMACMWVCIGMYVCVCKVFVCIRMYACGRVSYVCTYVRMHACVKMCAKVYVCTDARTYAGVYTYAYTYVELCQRKLWKLPKEEDAESRRTLTSFFFSPCH